MRLAGISAIILGTMLTACMMDDNLGRAGVRESTLDIKAGGDRSSLFTPHAFVPTDADSLSTFGLDVDKAAYTFHRKVVMQEGLLPRPEAVRTEEFLNYFGIAYPNGRGDEVFLLDVEAARSPFRDSIVNLRIGIQARAAAGAAPLPWNLTFLVDVSGSMAGRLEMVQGTLERLVDAMREGDRISIATYAGSVSTVLDPTTLREKDRETVKGIIRDLRAGGGTAMADGLENAYAVNRRGFLAVGVNRVIVCSDGDANIGATGFEAMLARIRHHKEEGITLSTLGFGIGNYNDADMEMLADRGNGNYYYIDSDAEAARLFSEELTAMMRVVAWDARIQLSFASAAVKSYRLLGYENRNIADTAFRQDTTDAGEIGAGHTVTALYELVLADPSAGLGKAELRYRDASGANRVLERDLGTWPGGAFTAASGDFRFAVAVAEYAEILRRSPHTRSRMSDVLAIVGGTSAGGDAKRAEFAEIVRKAAGLE